MQLNLKQTLEFAQKLAVKAGKYILKSQATVEVVVHKDQQDVATNVDLESERRIISALKSQYPHHSILSEEAGLIGVESEYQWLVDPLDGTKEYSRGLSQYNTCLTLINRDYKPLVSVVYVPVSDDCFSAAKGLGSFHNGHQIHVSSQSKLNSSFIYGYLPSYKESAPNAKHVWDNLFHLSRHCYRFRGVVQESVSMSWVASAKAEATVNLGSMSKFDDTIPGMLIAIEAGAIITTRTGTQLNYHDLTSGFVVSNGFIHQQLLDVINQKE